MSQSRSDEGWWQRELDELRDRERTYRTRLWQSEALAARLRAHTQAMQQLLLQRPPSNRRLERALEDVARISAQALEVARTSVWCFDDSQTHLRCVLLLEEETENTPPDLVIESASCPSYVHALATEFAVAVADVWQDTRTRELSAYLKEHDVGALLDIPIVVPDRLLGVVCHEHVGGTRVWHEREVDFAAGVGRQVALTLATEQRILAEHAARHSEARYRDLVESLPVTVYSFEVEGTLTYLSPRVQELTGYTPEQWRERGAGAWIHHIPREDRAPVLDRFQRGGEGGFADEVTYRFKHADGQTRWLRDTCRVVRDVSGQPLAIQGVLLDVSEGMRAEQARIEFERRYRFLLENVDLLAVTLDREGGITYANPAFLHAIGMTREQVLGHDYFTLTLPESLRDIVRDRYLGNIRKGTIDTRFEIDLVTRVRGTRRLLCTTTLLCDASGEAQGASTLALDVTDRRRLETELLVHTKLESLGRLAAGVAHDFNNLLTVLLAQVDLLKLRAQADPSLGKHLDTMDQVLTQASDLTQALMMLGRREPSKEKEKSSLDALISESRPLLEALVGKGASLIFSLDAPNAKIVFDKGRMRQVLMNLVGNAVDAVAEHGGEIHVSTHMELLEETDAIERGAERGGEFLVLAVEDDGCGMDAATRAAAFEPFFTTKPGGRGTGLGLAITQSVVSQLQGFVEVDSQVGRGTTFRLYLPVVETPSRVAAARRQDVPRRVLVVGPNLQKRAALAGPLGAAGYEVRTAPDTRNAVDMLVDNSVDLLITEQDLPDGSGSVLARSVRRVRPNLRIIAVATSPVDDDVFDATLVQPFDEERLLLAAELALGVGAD